MEEDEEEHKSTKSTHGEGLRRVHAALLQNLAALQMGIKLPRIGPERSRALRCFSRSAADFYAVLQRCCIFYAALRVALAGADVSNREGTSF